MKFKVGDIVRGTVDSPYNITNHNMTRGMVTEVTNDGSRITVKVLEHTIYTQDIGQSFHGRDPQFYELMWPLNTAQEEVIDV